MFGRKIHNFFGKTKKKKKNTQGKISHYFFEEKKKHPFIGKRRNKHSGTIRLLQKSILKKSKTWFIIPLITGAIAIIYLGIFSSFLKVTNIYIFREDSIINIDQAYGNIDYIRGQNILRLNTNEIATRLQKSQKSISSLSFDIDFPNTLNIHIGSYPILFQTTKHLILSNGIVVTKGSKKYPGVPQLSTSENIDDYAVFGNSLNRKDLENLRLLIEYGEKNILGLNFKQMKYFIKEKELLMRHESGSIFIFDLSHNVATQIEKLAIYKQERGNIYEKRYLYIDMRIPEKMFLCGLEAEYNCKKNLQYIYGESIFEDLQELSEPQQGDLPVENP